MNTSLRRGLLAAYVLIAAYVGIWAEFFPRRFYTAFPGFGLHWIDVDGPFNEHLIRDVGALYLALGAASLAARYSRSAEPGRVVGLAWFVFGVPHLAYHLAHLDGSAVDKVGLVLTLGASALIGLVLLFPLQGGTRRTAPE